jgi:acyl-ACP thioesterase
MTIPFTKRTFNVDTENPIERETLTRRNFQNIHFLKEILKNDIREQSIVTILFRHDSNSIYLLKIKDWINLDGEKLQALLQTRLNHSQTQP